RRRHTRWPRDWSSDVCSSDLNLRSLLFTNSSGRVFMKSNARKFFPFIVFLFSIFVCSVANAQALPGSIEPGHQEQRLKPSLGKRSEERRVGKECRVRWGP